MADKSKKRFKPWQKLVLSFVVVLFLAGVGLMAFPAVSNFVGQQRANGIIEEFNDSVSNIIPKDDNEGSSVPNGITSKSFEEARKKGEVDDEGYIIDSGGNRTSFSPVIFEYDLDALYRDSVNYNKSLIHNQGTVETTNYSEAALKMDKYGLSNFYCYLSAPTIDLYLPVYLGANDAMMSCGAAHLAGTSLPIDQGDTNCAIAGHTGYIGRIFFDNIRKLKIADKVTIHNYWESIDYKVVDCKIVKPNQTADIYIQDGRQLLTLITCVKSKDKGYDRYLVICEKQN